MIGVIPFICKFPVEMSSVPEIVKFPFKLTRPLKLLKSIGVPGTDAGADTGSSVYVDASVGAGSSVYVDASVGVVVVGVVVVGAGFGTGTATLKFVLSCSVFGTKIVLCVLNSSSFGYVGSFKSRLRLSGVSFFAEFWSTLKIFLGSAFSSANAYGSIKAVPLEEVLAPRTLP